MTSAEAFCANYFDYLIVGGGTASLVLASRLSEDPNVSVGVLEAGTHVDDMPEVNIPAMIGRNFGNPKLDWGFSTKKQPALFDRRVLNSQGKGVGGTSAVNFLVYQRASKEEYDAIEALGNPGWNWDSFLKYMMKSEKYNAPTDAEISKDTHIGYGHEYHGASGPVKTSISAWFNGLHSKFMETLVNMGIPINRDPGNGKNVGASVGVISVNPDTMTRSYSATAYYVPNSHRKNLAILTGAHVTKVLLENATASLPVSAAGVEFLKDSQKFTAKAKHEVIVAAGALQTPKILELSGIGKTDILTKHGIQTVLDLPVGENLRTSSRLISSVDHRANLIDQPDHLTLPLLHEVPNNTVTFDNLRDPLFLQEQTSLYQNERKGLLAGSITGYAYLPLEKVYSVEALDAFGKQFYQDASLAATPALKKQSVLLKKWLSDPNHAHIECLNMFSDAISQLNFIHVRILQFPLFLSLGSGIKPQEATKYHTILIVGLHPLSRGSVHIADSDPLTPPAIDPKYLSHAADLEIMVNGVKFVRRLLRTEPYYSSEFRMYDPPEKNAENIDLSDDEIRDWCRSRVESIFHPVGTAPMMPREDGGVVDPFLKVYGTTNLRVVDASVIPLHISTHPQATIYAIAEKASDIIKAARA
ncbi:hypothetical protein GYMLUDRAFT_235428 [Collybiopsis luxurians FD-317 M1]|nr:hypothetical protein GYMLUDRAFT_235428 [Collybiopsis luxurians FD-317 M1]